MAKPNMKVDAHALSDSSSRIASGGEHAKSRTSAALHTAEKLGATAGHKVFAALVDGVFDELRGKLPDDIARLIKSYADALLALQSATSGTDQALAQEWQRGGSGTNVIGGLTAISVAAAGGGAFLQGSGPAVQGGSISIQGFAAQGDMISPSSSSGPKQGAFQPMARLSPIGLGSNDANQATLDKYTKWLNDPGPGGGLQVRNRRGDSGSEVDCTTWAIWRRTQIEPGIQLSDDQLYWGMGNQLAGKFPAASTVDEIDVGSLISSSDGGAGHVMVVEEVISRHPLQLRMSEGNVIGNFSTSIRNISTSTVLTFSGDGPSLADGSWTIQRPGRTATPLRVVGTSLP